MVAASSLGDLLKEATAALRKAGIADAGHEARLIVGHFAGVSSTELISAPDRRVSPQCAEAVQAALARRTGGEPVHRILGRRSFYGIDLSLSYGTLEPRPDTEILVDRIILRVRRIIAAEGRCKLLDLGTGTGAIALALLAEIDGLEAIGVDVDEDAVRTANKNAEANRLNARFRAFQSNWFEGVDEKFHVIVSNPPYISEQEFETLSREVRHFDPKMALIGGIDGLDAYRAIAKNAAGYLLPHGIVGVEIGYKQREAVCAIFEANGYRLVEQAPDLAGNDRVLIFTC